MKHLRMLGLAAIAAMGLAAFAGAGTASATKLCTEAACGAVYPAATAVEATLKANTTTQFTGGGGETLDTCNGSTIAGKTTNKEGVSVFVGIEALNWQNCTAETVTIAKGSLGLERIGVNEAKVVGQGSEVTISLFGVTCTYGTGAGTMLGTLTGGAGPVLSINTALSKQAGGFLCPATTGWDAEYTFTKPHAILIGA